MNNIKRYEKQKRLMKKQEDDIYTLCTCYTLDYLIRQADAMRAGIELHEEKAAVEILEMIPDLTIDTLEKAISCYDKEKYKYIRDNYWCDNDRDYDVQTLCTCYSLHELIGQRDSVYNKNTEKTKGDPHEVLYIAEIDVLEEAIAKFNEERFQKVREKFKKGRKA